MEGQAMSLPLASWKAFLGKLGLQATKESGVQRRQYVRRLHAEALEQRNLLAFGSSEEIEAAPAASSP
jgi:hypothetical protein